MLVVVDEKVQEPWVSSIVLHDFGRSQAVRTIHEPVDFQFTSLIMPKNL